MATSSIHIEAGANGYFAHNSRESKTVNSIFDDEKNFCSCTNAQAFETYKNELAKRTEAYKENFGRTKLHSKTITHLSAIVNFNKEHSPKDIKKICDYLENKFDTKVIQYAMHRDEGHINQKGEKIKNYHAHIEFMGLDSKGNSVRRKLDKKVELAIRGGCTMVQLREKNGNMKEFYHDAAALRRITDTYGIPLIINDRLDLMLAIDAPGIHVGQNDIPASIVRRLIGAEKIMGVSAHNVEEALQAERDGADYIGVGAVFSTNTKKNTKNVTIKMLQEIVKAVSIPVVAIGGINCSNVKYLHETGISGIAVVSAILGAAQAYSAAKKMKKLVISTLINNKYSSN